MRPRILKNSADYDKLRDAEMEKQKRLKDAEAAMGQKKK